MKEVRKDDEYVRRAIFKVYGGKCFYTGNPLEYIDMQLDHIIPESLKHDREKYNNLIRQYKLNENFSLNSLENLVPTSRFENRRKSNLEYNEDTIRHYLEKTTRMAPKIQKEIEILKKNSNFESGISNVKAYIDDIPGDREREQALEKLVGFINNEDIEFSEYEEFYDFENQQAYKKYTKKIGIEAILPKYNDCETRCVLYFKTLKIRDCKVILENETILKELFSGLFTDPKHGIRGFIEFDDEFEKNFTFETLDRATIKLGNNRLRLNYEDIYSLCDIIDSYGKVYIEKIKEIEKTLKSSRFPLSKRRHSYKFMAVTPEEWYSIIQFAKKHDVDCGNSTWNIFDSSPPYSMIKVYTSKSHSKYEFGYHSFFNIEKDENCVFHPDIASNKLVITWTFIEDIDRTGKGFLNERENWDAEYAYQWLTKEFLPKVGVRLKKKIFFNKSKLELEEFFENNKIKFIKYININEVFIQSDLKTNIEALQRHFYGRPKEKYRLKSEEFSVIYTLLISLIKIAKKVDMYYICDKLEIGKCNSVEEVILKLEKLIETTEDKTIIGFNIDIILRAFLSLLKHNDLKLDRREILHILNQLEFLIEIYNRETLLDKYALSFLTW